MSDEPKNLRVHLLVIALGFMLTTVVGGLIGAYLQHRSWSNQWIAQKNTRDIELATKAFERISSLVDKRNYRMRRLLWGLQSNVDDIEFGMRLNHYREVLFEWNDNLNANLAIARFYFGDDVRRELENEIGRSFLQAGEGLQCALKYRIADQEFQTCKENELVDTEKILEQVGYKIYHFNLSMLSAIENLEKSSKPASFSIF